MLSLQSSQILQLSVEKPKCLCEFFQRNDLSHCTSSESNLFVETNDFFYITALRSDYVTNALRFSRIAKGLLSELHSSKDIA